MLPPMTAMAARSRLIRCGLAIDVGHDDEDGRHGQDQAKIVSRGVGIETQGHRGEQLLGESGRSASRSVLIAAVLGETDADERRWQGQQLQGHDQNKYGHGDIRPGPDERCGRG